MDAFYDCPECGAQVQVGQDEKEIRCPSCRTELVVDRDADYRDGWVDETRLIPKRGGAGAGVVTTTISIPQVSRMLAKARERSGKISLPVGCSAWADAARIHEGNVYLYYNEESGTTKTIVEPLDR